MVRSMTGFGRGDATGEWGRIVVEIKAVNHRFLDVVFRMPRQFGEMEEPARKLLQGTVSRGRLEVYVSWEPAARSKTVHVDKDLALAYHNALKELGREIGSNTEISVDTLTKLPDVLKVEEGQVSTEELWPIFQSALLEATEGLVAMREREGSALAADLYGRIDAIDEMVQLVAERSPQVVEDYRARLSQRLEELLPQGSVVDPQRLAQEVAIFADRCDITEETQRLASHLAQFRQTLEKGGTMGRKLDFLVQEIGREINTIGSKANDAAIAAHVVEAKGELEKIREQVQNIE